MPTPHFVGFVSIRRPGRPAQLFLESCRHRPDMLDAALEVYEPAVGRRLDRDRIRLYNAECAIGYLAFRSGAAPDQKSCGRTLAEDLRWVRTARAKLK